VFDKGPGKAGAFFLFGRAANGSGSAAAEPPVPLS